MNLSSKSYDLILNFEVGGEDGVYYSKYLSTPKWPKGEYSAITLGIGIDIFHWTEQELRKMLWDYLEEKDLALLISLKKYQGEAAKAQEYKLKHINIEFEKAVQIFDDFVVPKFYQGCVNIFPKFEDLHEDAKGALFSLCYNRGFSLVGASRKELLNITKLTAKKQYEKIAAEILSMKRLWTGKGLDGLLARRDAEAALIMSCVK